MSKAKSAPKKKAAPPAASNVIQPPLVTIEPAPEVIDATPPVVEPTVIDTTPPVVEPTVIDATPPVVEPTVIDATPPVIEPTVIDATPPVVEPTVIDATPPVVAPTVDDVATAETPASATSKLRISDDKLRALCAGDGHTRVVLKDGKVRTLTVPWGRGGRDAALRKYGSAIVEFINERYDS